MGRRRQAAGVSAWGRSSGGRRQWRRQAAVAAEAAAGGGDQEDFGGADRGIQHCFVISPTG